jgi:hypothetical protein
LFGLEGLIAPVLPFPSGAIKPSDKLTYRYQYDFHERIGTH